MPTMPTASERTDTALTLARTKAAAYADAGNMEMAYRALLRGAQSAQRVVNSSQTRTFLAGLWAMPAVKTGLLGGAAAVTAAVSRSKSKPNRKSNKKAKSARSKWASPSSDTSVKSRSRFRRRGNNGSGVTTARDIMSGNTECASASDSLADAARKMRDLDVGALPICGENDRLQGMITDRDIVVKCIADGGDPGSTRVLELAEGKPVTIGADDSVEEALRTMSQHGVRRLPVIDGQRLVGMVSQADIAKNLPEESVGDLVEAISSAPSNG